MICFLILKSELPKFQEYHREFYNFNENIFYKQDVIWKYIKVTFHLDENESLEKEIRKKKETMKEPLQKSTYADAYWINKKK